MSEGNGKAKPVAMLGMPGYGGLSAGAARGFYRASAGKLDLRLNYQESSLLALNMNGIWCKALNASRTGRLDYFAMLHSDIEPEDFWLDRLVDELEERDLDVLGVAVPIKDGRGVTSTALGRHDGNTWRVKARITMKELFKLPETFTSEDVGHPLLLNTGCWVCRFNEEWARKVYFTINDGIFWDQLQAIYHPQNEPEDWFFSRLLHELGLKVGCTRKIRLGHRGEMVYSNHRPWGQHAHDEANIDSSLFEHLPEDWFPFEVEGWLTEREGRELARLAAGKDVLEVGAFKGRSTICLAREARTVDVIDTFDGRATPQPGPTLREFRENTDRRRGRAFVGVHRGSSAEVLPTLAAAGSSYDLVFIDGDHDEAAVRADVDAVLPLLRPGGLLALHDYGNKDDPGVKAAVDSLLLDGRGELLSQIDSMAVIRPAASLAPVGGS